MRPESGWKLSSGSSLVMRHWIAKVVGTGMSSCMHAHKDTDDEGRIPYTTKLLLLGSAVVVSLRGCNSKPHQDHHRGVCAKPGSRCRCRRAWRRPQCGSAPAPGRCPSPPPCTCAPPAQGHEERNSERRAAALAEGFVLTGTAGLDDHPGLTMVLRLRSMLDMCRSVPHALSLSDARHDSRKRAR